MKIKFNISLKLIGLMLAVSVLPLLIFQLVSYNVVLQTTVDVATRHYSQLLQSELNYLNLQTDQIDALGESPAWANEFERLRAMANTRQGEDASYADLLTQERLGQLLSGYANLGCLDSIDLYTPEGFQYHMGEPLGQTQAGRLSEQMARAKAAGGRNVWLGFDDATNLGFNNRNVIVSVKSIYSRATGGSMRQPVGLLRSNVSTEHLYGHFKAIKISPGGQLLIVDDKRRLLFHTDMKLIGQPLAGDLPSLLRGAAGTLMMRLGQDDVLLSYLQVPDKNWYLISIVPQTTLLAPMHLIKRTNAALLVAGLLLIAVITWLYLRRVVEPLQRVSDAFRNFQADRLDADWRLPKLKAWVQIAELATWFNAFLDTMQTQVQSQQALRESEERYRTAFLTSPDSVNITRLSDGLYLEVNDGFLKMFGWTREDCLGRTTQDIKLWQNPQDRKRLIEPLRRDGHCENLEAPLVAKDGRVMVCLMSAHTMEFKGQLCILGITRDITERKATEDQLRKLSQAIEQSPASIVITNTAAEIEYANAAFLKTTGYGLEEVQGKNPRILKSGKTPAESYKSLWEELSHGRSWKGELHNQRKDGSQYVESAVIAPIRQPDGAITHYVAVKEDITASKQAEELINTLAFYDPLTALPNRRLLIDRLQQALATSTRHQRQGALLMVDLDNFKDLNDGLDHGQGDLVLQQVAKRLVNCIREGDTVARPGADEFLVLLAQLDQNPLEAALQAEIVGNKILDTLGTPYQFNGSEMPCTASIGIALFGERHEEAVEPMKRAELAMYQAKAQGRNTMRFFDPKMQATVNARVAMEASLRDAVALDQLVLHYQPQVTDEGKITGVEALLRWLDPKRGMVSPAEFIPVAEETGLILPIGNWVLETACKQLALWTSQPGIAHLTVAVNVSAKQFHQRDFVDRVLHTLERTGANAHLLKLELTESLLVEDVEGVIAKMNALKARGVTFSLDDFGTGYSSLSYLQRLPLDQLKIDQGFVRDILANPNDAAIAKMVIALAASLRLTVIPEGVETPAQREFLSGLGCHNFQGYLFSRPLPIDQLEAFVLQLDESK